MTLFAHHAMLHRPIPNPPNRPLSFKIASEAQLPCAGPCARRRFERLLALGSLALQSHAPYPPQFHFQWWPRPSRKWDTSQLQSYFYWTSNLQIAIGVQQKIRHVPAIMILSWYLKCNGCGRAPAESETPPNYNRTFIESPICISRSESSKKLDTSQL